MKHGNPISPNPIRSAEVCVDYRPFVPEYVVRLLAHDTELPVFDLFDSVTVFGDIVGFTPMSAALGESGRYGAEEVSDILNGFFAPMIDLVDGYGGMVANFAGDAITAVFPMRAGNGAATMRRAVQCALAMEKASRDFTAVETGAGTFQVAMRAGVGAGPTLVAVLGDPSVRLEHTVTGDALERAIAAERRAGAGQVVIGKGIPQDVRGVELDGAVVRAVRPQPRRLRYRQHGSIHAEAESRLPLFLHPTIAERIRRDQGRLLDEHRLITVAFVGSPHQAGVDVAAVNRLQRHVSAAAGIIDRWGGHLRQVDMGDQSPLLVVAFGTPVRHEDHEERAVRCCLELLRLSGGPFRAGVTTGRAWCGEVGSRDRREYAIVGDAVNLAARLQESAEPGQILADRATWEGLRGAAVGERLSPIAVKGKPEPVEAWLVHGAGDDAHRTRGPAVVSSLVGREVERAAARDQLDRVCAGQPAVLAIVGEAGVGKSRLATEVANQARTRGCTTAAGTCRSGGLNTSYFVWRLIWLDLLAIDRLAPIAEQQAKLSARYGDKAPVLAPLLGIPVPDTPLTAALDASARAELLRSLLLEDLQRLSSAAPVMLLLEDCHWIDPSSRTLFEFLARHLADRAVFFVATTRPSPTEPEPLAELRRLPHFVQIALQELPAQDAETLARQLAAQLYRSGTEPPADMIRRIVERSGGNPFYIEELVHLVHARGLRPESSLDLPDSVERVVMARLDQLSEAEKAVIKVASVIGRRFRAEWISGVYPPAGSAGEVARHLRRLEDLRLTPLQAIAPEPEYGFRHAITQEVTYDSLSLRMRTVLHERVGDYVERTYPDRLSQFVDVLAHHYGCTNRVDKQRVWFRAAGDAAKAGFANDAAIGYYERLLSLLSEREGGHVLVDLGSVWQLVGRWAEAERAYQQAREIAESVGDRSLLASAARELGDLFMHTQSYAQAIDWLNSARIAFEELGDQQGLSRTLDRLGFALVQQGAYEHATAVAQRHLEIATETGDLSGVSAALDYLGIIREYTGDLASAMALQRRSLEVAWEAGDRRGVSHAANNLGDLYIAMGEHEQGLACLEQALAAAREIGYRQVAAVVVGNIGDVYLERGEYERATDCFAHALETAVDLGDWTSVANRTARLAVIAGALGNVPLAEQRFAAAIALARRIDAPHFLCEWLEDLAELLFSVVRSKDAEPLNDEALRVAAAHGERETEQRARLLSIRLRVALHGLSAEEAVRELRDLQRSATGDPERAAVLEGLAELGQAPARSQAARLYRKLYDRAPSVRYGRAYQRLTGASLPQGPMLPPMSGGFPGPVEVDALLQEVEQLAFAVRPM